ncbi:MAG: redoxin domain-containing protein [Nesterenkonia sp.]|uniref:redoxin domain-containing protein n=1 Tax=Nesterenkonia marinintestina TaxID=2979865 RepID=UPI0021C01ABB|nr:redoxin domain-containing protein [Nesterenkonia sp. GX14115]MDO5492062.1 redoxin domain-containing protein [Nesterenkonia sp.]
MSAAAGASPGLPAPTRPPEPGTTAPGFAGRTHHGEDLRLEDLAGGPSALVFFPFAFSRICGGELAALHARRSLIERAGARVVGVSCDAMHTLRAYAEELVSSGRGHADGPLGLTLLSDFWPHGAISESYGCFDPARGAAGRLTVVLDPELTVTAVQTSGAGEARDPDRTVDLLRRAG